MKKWACMVCAAVFVGLVVFLPQLSVGQGKKPIKIGVVADKTGGLAAYGYSHEKVLRAAAKMVNEKGGINGRPVELAVEDTESKPSVGALKFRKLVETDGVDFMIDSNMSGVAVACAPIAKELKTPYFPSASATEISGEKGNRYVFQLCTSVREEAKGTAKWAVENLGKKWVIVVVNFAWGWSNQEDFTKYVTENGGQVLEAIRVPLGASDWLPYLKGKIPKEADAVYLAAFGSDFLSAIRDIHAVRPDIKKLGAVYALAAQDPAKLGPAGEGMYCITSYPTNLQGLDTPVNKQYREIIGVDPVGIGEGHRNSFCPGIQLGCLGGLLCTEERHRKSELAGQEGHPQGDPGTGRHGIEGKPGVSPGQRGHPGPGPPDSDRTLRGEGGKRRHQGRGENTRGRCGLSADCRLPEGTVLTDSSILFRSDPVRPEQVRRMDDHA